MKFYSTKLKTLVQQNFENFNKGWIYKGKNIHRVTMMHLIIYYHEISDYPAM